MGCIVSVAATGTMSSVRTPGSLLRRKHELVDTHIATMFPALLHVTPVIPAHSLFSSHVSLPGKFPQAALSCWRMDPDWQANGEEKGKKSQIGWQL